MSKVETASDLSFARDVEQSHGLVLVDFWAPWCAPCRFMGPVLDRLADAEAGRVRVVKVNVDENPVTAARFGVHSIPTLTLLADGRELTRITGAVPRSAVDAMIAPHLPESVATEGVPSHG
ncbi:MAG TPA: thioredoxin [Gemmatimonadaceae bacterium]